MKMSFPTDGANARARAQHEFHEGLPPPMSPFAAGWDAPMLVAQPGSASGSGADARPISLGGAAGLLEPIPTRPFLCDAQDLWHSGAHLGRKPKNPMRGDLDSPRSVNSPHGSPSPRDAASVPPIFISQLFGEADEKYYVTQTLTEGSQGKFRIAARQSRYYGVKEYRLRDKGPGHTTAVRLADIEHEWRAAQSCNANLHVHDVILHGEKISVITDLFGQDLEQAVKRISPARRAIFVRGALLDLAETLVTMHAKGHLHLDVKPSNALVANGFVTLCDFGLSTKREAIDGTSGLRGTPAFVAPERWRALKPSQNTPQFDEKVDVWAWELSWSQLHQIDMPFSYCDATSLGQTFMCLNAYDQFLQEVTTAQGDIDVRRIECHTRSQRTGDDQSDKLQRLVDAFYAWALAGMRIDAECFIYFLKGPLQSRPERRPAMAEAAQWLRSRIQPRDTKFYAAIAERLSDASRYQLPAKRSGGLTRSPELSGKTSYSVDQIKADLQSASNSCDLAVMTRGTSSGFTD